MRRFKRAFALFLSAVMLMGTAAGCGKSDSLEDAYNSGLEESAASGDDTGYVASLTPASDYYGFINGEKLLGESLNEKYQEIDSFQEVDVILEEQMDSLIDEIVSGTNYEKGSYEQIVHDMYYLLVDTYNGTKSNTEEDIAIVDGIMEEINAPQDVAGLFEMWHNLYMETGVTGPLGVAYAMNYLNNEECIFTVSFMSPADLESIKGSDAGSVINRDQLADVFKQAGIPSEEATNRSTDMILALHDIASYTDFEIANGEKRTEDFYAVYPASEFSAELSNITIDDLLYAAGYSVETPEKLAVNDIGQWHTIDSLMDNDHIQIWKDMTICSFMTSYSNFLPDKYASGNEIDTPADKRAKNFIKSRLEEVMGELYAKRYYTEEKRENITRMCNEIKAEYYVLIDEADDITEDGKAFLKRKLDKMTFYVGADKPHEIDPTDGDYISDTLLQTLINYNKKCVKEDIAEYGKAPDKNGFDMMAACTVNACYVPQYNCINITAAISNYPFYDENGDYYANLGRIGSVIGHEISHAFDSNGVKYDENGNINLNSFNEQDKQAFKDKQQNAIDYYNKFTVLGSHVNGELTLGENLADISGVQCCVAIAGTPENQKEVLENYASLWCALISDKSAKNRLETDTHSPALVRVNAVVACFDEFYDIYGVKEGDAMYVAPEERVRRW